jgi:hypothetical protein
MALSNRSNSRTPLYSVVFPFSWFYDLQLLNFQFQFSNLYCTPLYPHPFGSVLTAYYSVLKAVSRFITSGLIPWKTHITCYQECMFMAPLPSTGHGACHVENASDIVVLHSNGQQETPLLNCCQCVLPCNCPAMGFPGSIA